MSNQRFALVIVNFDFDDKKFIRLKAPEKDADELETILRDSNIGFFDEVIVLKNQPYSIIQRNIARLFNNKMRDDLILLYYSGHGVLDDRGDLYLAAKDTESNLVRGSAISSRFVSQEMESSRARSQVLIFDCCFSGAFTRGSKPAAIGISIKEKLDVFGFGQETESSGHGKVVITATNATQLAWEGENILGEVKSSLFTHYLVEGVRNGGANPNNRWISIMDFYQYAYERVIPLQEPMILTNSQVGPFLVFLNPLFNKVQVPVSKISTVPEVPRVAGYESRGKVTGQEIVIIRDIPVNLAAQKAVVEILRFLIQQWKVRLILLDGGEGNVNVDYIRKWGKKDAIQKVAESMLVEGKISGPEYLQMSTKLEFELIGICDKASYEARLKQFLNAISIRDECANKIITVERQLDDLKRKILASDILELDDAIVQFELNTENLPLLIKKIYNQAKSNKLSLSNYPNLEEINTVLHLLDKINKEKIRVEAHEAIEFLKRNFPLESEKIINDMQSVRDGILNSRIWYSDLCELLSSINSWHYSWNNLKNYHDYIVSEKNIDPENTIDEIDEFYSNLSNILIQTDDEKLFKQALDIFKTMLQAVKVTMNPKSHQLYQDRRIMLNWSIKQLYQFGVSYGVSIDESLLSFLVSKSYESVKYFDLAREDALKIAKKTKEILKQQKENKAVLIVPGFNEPYIKKFLVAQGDTVDSITPSSADPTNLDKLREVVLFKQGIFKTRAF